MTRNDTPIILKHRLLELQQRSLELAEDNSEHWNNLFDEWWLQYHPRQKEVVSKIDSFDRPDFLQEGECLTDVLESIEKNCIINALEKNRWNKTKAAKALGITRRILIYKVKMLRIDDEDNSS